MSVNRSCDGYRRREFLLAGLGAVLATSACSVAPGTTGSLDGTRVLRPVLTTARRLAASYEAAAEQQPELKNSLDVLRENHSEHARAVAKLLGESEATGEPADSVSLESLRGAESDAADEAADACAGAPVEYAVLLGEIAACRATHHDVLKVLLWRTRD